MTVYDLLKQGLFKLPPETAHWLAMGVLKATQQSPAVGPVRRHFRLEDPRLASTVFGERFPNPVGIAAGFDKNAEVPRALAALGFGHVELGAVTAKPQAGNPRPRAFRLREDEALINRMGFNNEGADVVGSRLDREPLPDVPVGINIGKTTATSLAEAAEDYRYTYDRVAEACDFFVVNVSCPNTPELRELQDRQALEEILGELQSAGAEPLLVKLSPDLSGPTLDEALDVVNEMDLDGVVTTNTTTERPNTLTSPNRAQRGGLSGKPIEDRATDLVRYTARRVDVPVIGVGGVSDAEGAYAKIRAGASLVQLYTALIYEGPTVARDINRGLLELLERDGFNSIEKAVGADIQ